MNNIPIEFLAKILSVNYINVSISDTTEKQPKKHSAEFHNKLKYVINQSKRDQFSVNDFEHSRNILIIGNGASFPFTKNTKAIAKNIEDEILKKHQPYSKTEWLTNFKNEWRSIVEKIERKNVPFENSSTVSFETRMAALIKYLDKGKMVGDKIGTEEVLFQLKKHVNHKYLPSLFYELTAHLFKYRFIDVIINFNFDELLDNAIEDELEERSYLRIVHDSDIRGFNHICDLNRLKTPIYIKPHGTYSSPDSMLFTKESYKADISPMMKSFMIKVFHGSVNDKEKGNQVDNINILTAGFGFGSIELDKILQGLHKTQTKTVKYFIFDKNFNVHNNKISTLFKHSNQEIKRNVNYFEFDCNKTKLGEIFKDLYENKIRAYFEKPYTPLKPIRHSLLLEFFPEVKTNFIEDNYAKFKSYLERRVKFHLLYDLLKFNGYFASNVSINSRAGKYYQLLLKNEFDHRKNSFYKKNLSSLLKEALPHKYKDDLRNISDVSMLYLPFQKEQYNKLCKSLKTELYKKNISIEQAKSDLIKQIITIGQYGNKKVISLILHKAVYNSGINEISPRYTDPKLGRFYHFDKKQVLTTNLAFSHKFFELATNFNQWDELWFADDTGKAIYNLHTDVTELKDNDSYLHQIIKGNKVIVLHSISRKKVEVPEKKFKEEPIEKAIWDLFPLTNNKPNKNFQPYTLNILKSFHHMALFLKGKNKTPVFGIYFFKPGAKNRINPVYFDSTKNDSGNDLKNLIEMKRLFEIQSDEDPIIYNEL